MPDHKQPTIDLDDMITHDQLLERYTWLSGQIVNRWKRKRGLRYFRGAKGLIVYALSDVVRCLTEEMNEGVEEPPDEERNVPAASPAPERQQSTEPPRPRRPKPDYVDSPEAIEIRQRLFLEEMANRRKRKGPPKRPAG